VSDRPAEPEAFTIVGVLPADLWHLNVYTEVLAPLRAPNYPYMARLRAGVAASLAEERITALVRQGLPSAPADFRARVTSAQNSYVATVRPLLWSVGAAAALVLLIAGANVAVLMLVRGRRRQKELAVRLALGASHGRIARLLIAEAVLIGGAATALGIAVSQFALANVSSLVERVLERRVPGGLAAFDMDLGVWLAASACGFVVTVIFALAPLAAAWGSRLSPGLSSGARGAARRGPRRADFAHWGANSAGARRSHSALIGIEVAASLTLLAGAALMAESAIRMLRVDFGVEADGVITASLALRDRAFPDEADRGAFFERLTSDLTHLSGVSSVALGDWWPLQGSRPRRVDSGGAALTVAAANPFAVSDRYFDTLGMTLRDGRAFSPQDRIGSAPVVIISESLAQQLWPRQRAVGHQLTMYADDGSATTRQVIGVVTDVRQSHTDLDLNDVYLSLAQRPSRFAFIYLRAPQSATWESELRRTVARISPEVAVGAPRSLSLGLEQERTRPQFLAYLLTVFAILASVLALVGMHGVIAYAVRQRQREIAVRMAVGATSRAVTSMFLRDGLWVLTGGVIFGLFGAVGLGRVLQSQLHGVQPVEPRILVGASIVFVICGLAAIGWPARRAAAVNPSLILKEE